MNPKLLMMGKQRLDIFLKDHPKVVPFLKSVSKEAIEEGAVIEIKVTGVDGREHISNIKVTENDVETIRMLTETN